MSLNIIILPRLFCLRGSEPEMFTATVSLFHSLLSLFHCLCKPGIPGTGDEQLSKRSSNLKLLFQLTSSNPQTLQIFVAFLSAHTVAGCEILHHQPSLKPHRGMFSINWGFCHHSMVSDLIPATRLCPPSYKPIYHPHQL